MTLRTSALFYDQTGENSFTTTYKCITAMFAILRLYLLNIFICCVVIRVRAGLLYKEGG